VVVAVDVVLAVAAARLACHVASLVCPRFTGTAIPVVPGMLAVDCEATCTLSVSSNESSIVSATLLPAVPLLFAGYGSSQGTSGRRRIDVDAETSPGGSNPALSLVVPLLLPEGVLFGDCMAHSMFLYKKVVIAHTTSIVKSSSLLQLLLVV